jgi:electron transfer flavoprotein beta subunit
VKFVPDLVEELVIDESGAALDAMEISPILNEFDDHAIEQAILLMERDDAQVTVIAPDIEGADETLYTAAAKGADQLIRLSGEFDEGMSNHDLARMLATVIREINPGLILTGVQAHDDLDGQLGALLAEYLGLPYLGYVAGVKIGEGTAILRKEYPGGLMAELEVALPVVLGIQAAEEPPRYVVFSRVRQAMQTASIDDWDSPSAGPSPAIEQEARGAPLVSRLFQPVAGERATMIEGEADEIAARFLSILAEQGVL